MPIKQQVRARSPDELEPVWDWIDDASFSTSEIQWDREAREVVVPIANYCDDPDFPPRKPLGRTPLWESYRQPWFRATLRIRAALAMYPEPAELEEPGILLDVEWLAERALVRVTSSNEAASFDVKVDEFDVELVATDDIDHWREHKYGRLMPWASHGAVLESEPDHD